MTEAPNSIQLHSTLRSAPAGLHSARLGASEGKCTFSVKRSVPLGKLLSQSGRSKRQHSLPFASISFASMTPVPVFASTSATLAPATAPQKKELREILSTAGAKALSGGIPGMIAMGIQVLSLMWLRTTINYQYRYGTTTLQALQTLWSQGGVPRFYQGLAPALIQGPLSRFGDTAANTGTLALLDNLDLTAAWPVGVKTLCASIAAGLFRIVLMPVDTLKTIMQVEGKNALPALANKIKLGGPTVLYHGALAASLATFVGHYPWFATYNALNEKLPQYDELPKRLLRSAFIGFCSSLVSDCCSNSIRVLKTAKQTATTPMSYPQIIKMVVEKEGIQGLFLRGLGTKLITNGIQGLMFSVLWRLGQDYYAKVEKEKVAAAAASGSK